MKRIFFDTNILIYALGTDDKARIARRLLDVGDCVSVQCLNEFATVALRKLRYDWSTIDRLLAEIRRRSVAIVPLTVEAHVVGLRIARDRRLAIYDGMIVAAALEAGCDVLYSEDMQHGLLIDGRLTIINPFRG